MRLATATSAVFIAAAAAVSAGCSHRRTTPAAPRDPRDVAFADYALDAARNIVAAARGQTHDGRWDGPDPAGDLRATPASEASHFGVFGPQVPTSLVSVELEGTAQSVGGAVQIRTVVLVFPDGRVRWGSIESSNRPTPPAPARGIDPQVLATAAPALTGEFNRMIEALRGGCNLPVATVGDVAQFPQGAQRDVVRAQSSLPIACTTARTAAGAWQVHLDDVSVFARQPNGQYVVVRSQFRFANGRLFVSPAHVRPSA
jgi:hypothetical protein